MGGPHFSFLELHEILDRRIDNVASGFFREKGLVGCKYHVRLSNSAKEYTVDDVVRRIKRKV